MRHCSKKTHGIAEAASEEHEHFRSRSREKWVQFLSCDLDLCKEQISLVLKMFGSTPYLIKSFTSQDCVELSALLGRLLIN